MSRLEQISADELRGYLDAVEGKRASLRLVVGINYKEGVSQTEIADWYGISRTTVHHWLNRLERLPDEPLEAVVTDADRPGRPSKLTESQWAQLASILDDPPANAGIDATSWTPQLVQRAIQDEFGVVYTTRHVRDILDRIGSTHVDGRSG